MPDLEFLKGSTYTTTNGTTDVVVVAAPTNDRKRVINTIIVSNIDTTDATITLKVDDGTNERTVTKMTLATGDTLYYDLPITLDNPNKKLEIVLGGAITTNELDVVATYGELF